MLHSSTPSEGRRNDAVLRDPRLRGDDSEWGMTARLLGDCRVAVIAHLLRYAST